MREKITGEITGEMSENTWNSVKNNEKPGKCKEHSGLSIEPKNNKLEWYIRTLSGVPPRRFTYGQKSSKLEIDF